MFEMEDMTVRFSIGEALRGASVRIAPGDRLGIVGESGSGKSMLAACLMGMAPDSATLTGALKIDGVDMSDAPEATWQTIRARRAAMIFQEPMAALNPLRRVGDTVAEPMRVHLGLGKAQATARVIELFEEVGIPDPAARLRMFPHELSGGQRQRVLIALALACDPELLIADEPTTALDVTVQAQIFDLLNDIQRDFGTAIIMITHDMGAIAEMADRVAVMYAGKVIEQGVADDILDNPKHPYAQGLIACIPALGKGDAGRPPPLAEIPGVVPPLHLLGDGCAFADRCAHKFEACAKAPLLGGDPAHPVACHASAEARI